MLVLNELTLFGRLLGLYKGMAAPIVGVAAVNAVLFSSYGWFKELLGGRPKGGKWKNGRLLDDDLNIREIGNNQTNETFQHRE
jgi:hypothetical protein